MSGYVGVDNKARAIKGIFVGVNKVARAVKAAYVGVNGKARLWFSIGGDVVPTGKKGQVESLLGGVSIIQYNDASFPEQNWGRDSLITSIDEGLYQTGWIGRRPLGVPKDLSFPDLIPFSNSLLVLAGGVDSYGFALGKAFMINAQNPQQITWTSPCYEGYRGASVFSGQSPISGHIGAILRGGGQMSDRQSSVTNDCEAFSQDGVKVDLDKLSTSRTRLCAINVNKVLFVGGFDRYGDAVSKIDIYSMNSLEGGATHTTVPSTIKGYVSYSNVIRGQKAILAHGDGGLVNTITLLNDTGVTSDVGKAKLGRFPASYAFAKGASDKGDSKVTIAFFPGTNCQGQSLPICRYTSDGVLVEDKTMIQTLDDNSEQRSTCALFVNKKTCRYIQSNGFAQDFEYVN